MESADRFSPGVQGRHHLGRDPGHPWTLQATGLALLVLFFAAGAVKTCGSYVEFKRPEQALKIFVRFAIAKGLVTYGMELILALLEIAQGMLATVMTASGSVMTDNALPESIQTAIEECSLLPSLGILAVALIGMLVITVLSFMLVITVYGRIFRIYLYTAISPIPLSAFAGEPTSPSASVSSSPMPPCAWRGWSSPCAVRSTRPMRYPGPMSVPTPAPPCRC